MYENTFCQGQDWADYILYNFIPSKLILHPRTTILLPNIVMNISILRDCSPSEVPNFGTDVPILRTFLFFFYYRRFDGVESPEGLENAPAPKFIPAQNSTHPSSETTVSLFPDPIPDFFRDFRISIPSLTIPLPNLKNRPRARN